MGRREPAALINMLRLVLLAVVSLGLDLSGEQILAIMAAVEAFLTWWTRREVTPVRRISPKLKPPAN